MGMADVVALALAIGTDCFSVCLGLAMEPRGPKRTMLVSAVFGGMQAALVALGYHVALGIRWVVRAVRVSDEFAGRLPFGLRLGIPPESWHDGVQWVLSSAGATVLMAVGIGLISDFLAGQKPGTINPARITLLRGRLGLALVGVMVNIDAFSAGIGLGMLDDILLPHVLGVMALVGSSLSRLGFEAGSKFGQRLGRIAQPIGGGLIILVALKAIAGLVMA